MNRTIPEKVCKSVPVFVYNFGKTVSVGLIRCRYEPGLAPGIVCPGTRIAPTVQAKGLISEVHETGGVLGVK